MNVSGVRYVYAVLLKMLKFKIPLTSWRQIVGFNTAQSHLQYESHLACRVRDRMYTYVPLYNVYYDKIGI